MEKRGLFERLFGSKPQKVQLNSYFKTLTGYTPTFRTWNGGIYESELCRAAIESGARHASKLNIAIQGSARPALTNKLRLAPCEFLTWSQFFARVKTILEIDNTCFVVPVINEYGEKTGVCPVKPAWWELVQDSNNNPWVRFHFGDEKTAAHRLSDIGILTRHQYSSDFFGESSDALKPTLDLISIQNQGIKEGIKNSASFRFIAKFNNFLSDEDLKTEQQRFSEKSMRAGEGGGVLLFPNTYNDIKQVDSKPYVVSAAEMTAIRTNVFDWFNTNEKIIQNSGTDEDLDTYYNGNIEPFAIQLSEVLTKMLFTRDERYRGNQIIAASNRLQYMSVAHKVSMAKELGDRGAITINEIRQLFNLIPLPDEIGNKIPARGEYYDFAIGKEGDNNGKTDSE